MFNLTAAILGAAGRKIKRGRNILQHRTAVSLLSIFITCVVIFLMTGALYIRSEVTITDRGDTFTVLTMQTTPENILAEQGIALTGLDYYSFEGTAEVAKLSVTRSYEVTITVDRDIIKSEAFPGDTVRKVLSRAGVSMGAYDLIEPPLDSILAGNAVNIGKAFNITVYIDGIPYVFPVTPGSAFTVPDILAREGFTLSEEDIVSANFSSPPFPNMETAVSTIRYEDITQTVAIPYETREEPSNLLAMGDSKIAVKGESGAENVTTRRRIVEGRVVDEQLISIEVLKEPVTEVILIGKALAEPYSKRDFDEIVLEDGIPVYYESKVTGKSTAYTAGPSAGTASGRALQVGTVAVDPKKIPYGSLLYIISTCGNYVYGAAVAADTGEFIYSTDVVVDLFKGLTSENYRSALQWGARQVDVYVISTAAY